MKKLFDYKYRLYFRRLCEGFSQCKDPVYTDDIQDIYKALNNVQGYDEYMLITQTENGPEVERHPIERQINKRLVKKY
jgi:hypothetical protein